MAVQLVTWQDCAAAVSDGYQGFQAVPQERYFGAPFERARDIPKVDAETAEHHQQDHDDRTHEITILRDEKKIAKNRRLLHVLYILRWSLFSNFR